MRRALAAALVGATALTLTACTGTDSKDSSLPAKRAASKSTTSSTTLPFESNSTHTPGTLTGFVGAKNDVHDVKCAAHGDTWSATGTLTNPTRRPVKYRVYVSFLSGDTTVGIAESNSGRVGPKASTDFSASVKVDASDLHCILRVERTDA